MIRKIPILFTVPLCAWLVFAGCGQAPGVFVILRNQVPQAGCVVPGDPSAVYRGTGQLDLGIVTNAATRGYLVFPLLQNNFPGPAAGQTVDGNRIALSSFDVSLTPVIPTPSFQGVFDANPTLVRFNVLTSGSINSGGSFTAQALDAVPAELARRLAVNGGLNVGDSAQVLITLRARGRTVNGEVVSDEFQFPIDVCVGCLIGNVQQCPLHAAATNP